MLKDGSQKNTSTLKKHITKDSFFNSKNKINYTNTDIDNWDEKECSNYPSINPDVKRNHWSAWNYSNWFQKDHKHLENFSKNIFENI